MGCNGGYMSACYNYLKSSKLMTKSVYPYVAQQTKCQYNATKGVFNTKGYVSV